MKKGLGGLILRLSVSIVSIALVLWFQREHLQEALNVLRTDVSWGHFFLGIGTYVIALAVITLRLQYVFKVQDIFLSFRETFYLTWVGLFFNLFLPSAVGGDIAKAYYAYKRSGKKIQSTTSIIWDRLLGFATLIAVAMVAVLLFNKELNDIRIDYLVVLFLGFFGAVMLFFSSKRIARKFKFLQFLIPSDKLRKLLEEIYHSLYHYKGHLPILFFTLFLSLVGQSLFVVVHYWLTVSVGGGVNFWLFFILIPILAIVTMAPSLGGLGVREAAVVYLFARYMPNERALALSLLLDMLIYALSFVAGVLYAFKGGLKEKVIQEMEDVQP
jgi:glycosyltransferase 2 family protein